MKKTRTNIIQAAICNNLCDKIDGEKHPYCKELAMGLEIEDLGKMSMFKGFLKKKKKVW